MTKAIIIDDSLISIKEITVMLNKYAPQVKILDTALDVDMGIKLIQKLKPDLVFLDVEIGNKTGFDLLKAFPVINFNFIFVTGFLQYAPDAFDYNALHYIVKPIIPEKLIEGINRIGKNQKSLTPGKNDDSLKHSYHKQTGKRIAINTEKEILFIALDQILFIKAEGRYSILYLTNNKKIIVAKLLKEMEMKIANIEFCRVNKSHLINLNHISLIKHIDGGLIEMIDGTNISIPRRKKDELTIKITNYLSLL